MLSLDLGLDRPPLTSNMRLHWAREARIKADLRYRSRVLARSAKLPKVGRCRIGLVWTVTDHRKRDADNIAPTLKPCIDGLRDADVLAEDHFGIVVDTWQRIELGEAKSVRLVIEEVA